MNRETRNRFKAQLLDLPFWNRERERAAFVADVLWGYDLAGNVWEWCRNEYVDPRKSQLGGDEARVLRGGSWTYGQVIARAGDRDLNHALIRYVDCGIRVVCASPLR